MKKTKQSGKFYLALVIFSLVGQVAWVVENMYLNVFIYKMFHLSPADLPDGGSLCRHRYGDHPAGRCAV